MTRLARRGYAARVVGTSVAALAPLIVALFILAIASDASARTLWTLVAVVVVSLFIGTYLLHERVAYPLRTLANLISALREEDYTLRARDADPDDVLGAAMIELDALRSTIEERKLEAVEATALLRAVLSEIDAAIFAFDREERLRIANRAGERLLARPFLRIAGKTASELGLADLIRDRAPETIDRRFDGASGRWSVKRSTFREKGEPHRLLFVSDISRALREEEAQAWQRIVRVLSHELNNSLAPIKSISESLDTLVAREPLPDDWRDDVSSGLRIVASRADSLTRFMQAYARLARLPQPRKRAVDLGDIVRRVAVLETRLPIAVHGNGAAIVDADPDLIEQLLINVTKNAVEASLETGGRVDVTWGVRGANAIVEVEDEGLGLAGSANLFVPFFTTKPNGSGIGLVLSRQIADAHGGTLTLQNRDEARGCVARLSIPTSPSAAR